MAKEEPISEQRFVFWATILGSILTTIGIWWGDGQLNRLGITPFEMPPSLLYAIPMFIALGFSCLGTVYHLANRTRFVGWVVGFWVVLGAIGLFVAWRAMGPGTNLLEAGKKSIAMFVLPIAAQFLAKVDRPANSRRTAS